VPCVSVLCCERGTAPEGCITVVCCFCVRSLWHFTALWILIPEEIQRVSNLELLLLSLIIIIIIIKRMTGVCWTGPTGVSPPRIAAVDSYSVRLNWSVPTKTNGIINVYRLFQNTVLREEVGISTQCAGQPWFHPSYLHIYLLYLIITLTHREDLYMNKAHPRCSWSCPEIREIMRDLYTVRDIRVYYYAFTLSYLSLPSRATLWSKAVVNFTSLCQNN
jgi:hypothetical protein